MIRNHADPAQMAKIYERAGVCAISVLTEPEFFRGSLADLSLVLANTDLPVLRKDFVVDEYQIVEAAAAGADAILLIVAALSDGDLLRFRRLAEERFGLDALVEVHTAEEMRRAAQAGATLIGVNNRDLRTLATTIDTSVRLAPLAPSGATLVSESGIASPAQVRQLRECGYNAFLVGESLMRAPNPAEVIDSLRTRNLQSHEILNSPNNVKVKVCGITNSQDALACAAMGVEMVGLNFSPQSLRAISPAAAGKIVSAVRFRFATMKFVGVFRNQDLQFVQATMKELALDAVQLHGEETPEYLRQLDAPFVIKTFRVGREFAEADVTNYECDAILLDSLSERAAGGTGETFPWPVAVRLRPRVGRLIVAGGLTSTNVAHAIEMVEPFAVDVCSGVEQCPGRKNHEKVRRFIEAARAVSSNNIMP